MYAVFMKFFTYCSVFLFLSGCKFVQLSNLSNHQAVANHNSTAFFNLEDIVFSGSNWRNIDQDYLQSATRNYFTNLLVDYELSETTNSLLPIINVGWSKRLVAHTYSKNNTIADTILRKKGSINNVPKMMVSLTLRVRSQHGGKNYEGVELRDLFSILELNSERVETALSMGISKLIHRMD